jgi:hypothetical protein
MIMKKKYMMLIALYLVALATWAQGDTKRLVVWQKSGEKLYYDLADLPETSFENGMLVIKTNRTTVSYPLENILRYTYQGFIATGIEQLSNEQTVTVSREADSVTFGNLPEGTAICLYAANGTLLERRTANGEKTFSLSIKNRPGGVYIVKAGKQTIKLTRL